MSSILAEFHRASRCGSCLAPEAQRQACDLVRSLGYGGEGDVEHLWQREDDPTRVLAKAMHVLDPWGRAVGAGL